MTTRTHTTTGALAAVTAAAALCISGATPASADPPPAGAGSTTHGFVAKRGAAVPIDHPDATTTPATPDGSAGTSTTGINDRGEILGSYEGQDRVVRHFVRDRKGRYTEIADPPDGPDASAFDEPIDINNRREIVGFYNDTQGATTTGFLRTAKGRFVDLRVPGSLITGPFKINDRGQVVGIYADADEKLHGFLWVDGDYETIDVRGAAATLVLGINDRGQTVGSYIDGEGAYHGFLRDRDGTVTTLPDAPGADPSMGGTQPTSINERGQIAGLAYDAQGGSRAFRYERGRFTLLDVTGDATYARALDIDDRGRLVGDYGTRPAESTDGGAARRASLGGGVRLPATETFAWLP